jgi:hypothetical protein
MNAVRMVVMTLALLSCFTFSCGETKHASLLEQTLEDETETDEKLTELAEKINTQALEEGPRKEQGESKLGVKTTKGVARVSVQQMDFTSGCEEVKRSSL